MAASLSIFGSEMEPLEERVFRFVAGQTGVKVKKLTLDSRLLHDLGVDGDDATDFFDAYSKEFGVNIEKLRSDFGYYFGDEGGGPAIWMMVLWITSAIISNTLAERVGWLPWWGWLCSLVLLSFVTVLWISSVLYKRSGGDDTRYTAITIKDLVDSAAAGKWLEERPWRKTYLKQAH